MQEATGKELKRFLKPPPGQSLLSIDTANINLHGISAENVQQTLTQFYSRLRTSYQDDFTSNLLKIIGSMDILGDPMGLIRNVGGGFQDLYEMPKEGFIKGPIEGGIGIAKGVGSLTKGFVSGTFNTVQKITGSLAQGFSAITMVTKSVNLQG
jgi:vacuolar protein sorting-associated protein 13A/C